MAKWLAMVWVVLSGFAVAENPTPVPEAVSKLVNEAYRTMLRMGIDLPFEGGQGAYGDGIKSSWQEALRNLESASDSLRSDLDRGRDELAAGLQGTRKVGLMLPFYSVQPVSLQNELIGKFMGVEDKLEKAHAMLLGKLPLPPDPTIWYNNGLVWKALPDQLSHNSAKTACASLSLLGTEGWRLPDLQTLSANFRRMKGTANQAFGSLASTWGRVWASDDWKDADGTIFLDYGSTVDFKLEISHSHQKTIPATVVCVGSEAGRGAK